jgi:ribosomal protein S18 acetylase RimI-like enzyme
MLRRWHPCSSFPPESFPPLQVRALLAKPENIVLLARLGPEPAGYVYAEIVGRPQTSLRYAHAMIYLHHNSVATACRKRGIGRALFEAVRQIGTAWDQHAGTRRVAIQRASPTFLSPLLAI